MFRALIAAAQNCWWHKNQCICRPIFFRKSNMKNKFKLKRLSDRKDFPLTESPVLVGRGRECQIVVENGHASRKHANILLKNGDVVVSDLNSTNGTFVNGKRIEGEYSINVGDVIKFDMESFCLQWLENPEATIYSSPLDKSSPINSKGLYLDEEESDFDKTAFYSRSLLMGAVNSEEEDCISANEPVKLSPQSIVLEDLVSKSRTNFRGETGLILGFCYENSEPIVVSIVFNGLKKVWSIGRKTNCDISIDFQCVSEVHAHVNWQDGHWILEDNESTNGLWLNSQRVDKAELAEGTHLYLGSVEMVSYPVQINNNDNQESISA